MIECGGSEREGTCLKGPEREGFVLDNVYVLFLSEGAEVLVSNQRQTMFHHGVRHWRGSLLPSEQGSTASQRGFQ